MRGLLVAGAVALIAGACASSAMTPASLKAMRAPAATTANPTFVQGQPAELIISQQFLVHSKNTGADYLIQVAIPVPPMTLAASKMTVADLPKMFPDRDAASIYVLDGGSDFPLYTTYRGQEFIIGVQHTFSNWEDLIAGRERDLIHFPDPQAPAAAGGAKFAAFLTEELKPFIEARFPVDPKKAVLAGYSLGGMFTMRVLADTPDAFAGYIIGDPSSFDPGVHDKLRETLSKVSGKRVFVGFSDSSTPDMHAYSGKVVASLKSPGVTLETREFKGETHGTAGTFVAQKGMAWMFPLDKPATKPAN